MRLRLGNPKIDKGMSLVDWYPQVIEFFVLPLRNSVACLRRGLLIRSWLSTLPPVTRNI